MVLGDLGQLCSGVSAPLARVPLLPIPPKPVSQPGSGSGRGTQGDPAAIHILHPPVHTWSPGPDPTFPGVAAGVLHLHGLGHWGRRDLGTLAVGRWFPEKLERAIGFMTNLRESWPFSPYKTGFAGDPELSISWGAFLLSLFLNDESSPTLFRTQVAAAARRCPGHLPGARPAAAPQSPAPLSQEVSEAAGWWEAPGAAQRAPPPQLPEVSKDAAWPRALPHTALRFEDSCVLFIKASPLERLAAGGSQEGFLLNPPGATQNRHQLEGQLAGKSCQEILPAFTCRSCWEIDLCLLKASLVPARRTWKGGQVFVSQLCSGQCSLSHSQRMPGSQTLTTGETPRGP